MAHDEEIPTVTKGKFKRFVSLFFLTIVLLVKHEEGILIQTQLQVVLITLFYFTSVNGFGS